MNSRHQGYTLIELLVSLSIFAIIMLAITAAYLSLIDYNRQAQAAANVLNSLSFSIDRMARDIRTGSGYSSGSDVTTFSFTDALGCSVTYALSSATINRTVSGGGSCDNEPTGTITDPGVTVSNLRFRVRGVSPGDTIQPMVQMIVLGSAVVPNSSTTIPFDIETSATERFPDL